MNLAPVGLDAADKVGVAAERRGRYSLVSQAADIWLLVCMCVCVYVCVCSSHYDIVAMSLLSDWEKVEGMVLFFLRLMVLVLFSSSCFMSPANRPAMN